MFISNKSINHQHGQANSIGIGGKIFIFQTKSFIMRTFDFFNNINDFKEVVPGVEASTTLSEMQAAFERAAAVIKGMITDGIWSILSDAYFSVTEDENLQTAIAYLQGAIGNRTYYHHLIFKVVGKKKEQVTFYKSEIQEMRETYLDNYWTYMDKLLAYLDEHKASFEGWTDTEFYKLRQELILKTAGDFSKHCTLGDSVYFFMLTIPLQLEVIDFHIAARKITPDTWAAKPKLERNIKRAVAYATAADAIRQFDYPDLPRSLRNDIYNETSKKNGKQEEWVKTEISKIFESKSETYFSLVDQERSVPDQAAGGSPNIYIPAEEINDSSNSHFLMS